MMAGEGRRGEDLRWKRSEHMSLFLDIFKDSTETLVLVINRLVIQQDVAEIFF